MTRHHPSRLLVSICAALAGAQAARAAPAADPCTDMLEEAQALASTADYATATKRHLEAVPICPTGPLRNQALHGARLNAQKAHERDPSAVSEMCAVDRALSRHIDELAGASGQRARNQHSRWMQDRDKLEKQLADTGRQCPTEAPAPVAAEPPPAPPPDASIPEGLSVTPAPPAPAMNSEPVAATKPRGPSAAMTATRRDAPRTPRKPSSMLIGGAIAIPLGVGALSLMTVELLYARFITRTAQDYLEHVGSSQALAESAYDHPHDVAIGVAVTAGITAGIAVGVGAALIAIDAKRRRSTHTRMRMSGGGFSLAF